MPTLKDIAKQVTSLAQLNLTRGATKAYKTGNLYRNIGSYNTPNRTLERTHYSGNISFEKGFKKLFK